MISLYNIAQEYQQVFSQISVEDEISELDLEKLREIESSIEDKSINLAAFIKNLESEAFAVEEAEKAMRERRKKLENKVEHLRSYLGTILIMMGVSEIKKSPLFVIKIKNNPASVVIDNAAIVPKEFTTIKEVVTISKNLIKVELAKGLEVPGAHLEQTTRVEIK